MIRGRVVIIAPETGGIAQGVAKGFMSLGWKAELFIYAPPRRKYLVQVAFDRLSDPHCDEAYRCGFNASVHDAINKSIMISRPDLILILKGNYLDKVNCEALATSRVPLVLWAIDSLSRAPAQKLLAEMACHTFYIDGGDVPACGSTASWLPLGFDEEIYNPLANTKKNIDVLLVGTLGKRYRKRTRLIDILAKSNLTTKWRCGFIGSTGQLFGNLMLTIKYQISKRSSMEWISRRIPATQLAHAIAGAKLCLNIHQDDGLLPINPLFFAIPATGTCEIAEKMPHLAHWLKPGIEYAAIDEESLIPELQRLLSDSETYKAIAHKGYIASQSHTYEQRALTILKRIGYT